MAKTAEEKKVAKAAANKAYAAKKKAAALEAAKTPVVKKAPAKVKVAAKKAPAKQAVVKKATAKKEAVEKAPSKNIDVIADFLKVGDTTSIKSKAKSNLGEMIDARVVKIYACSRTGKNYVRLTADGHTYHKRLDALAPVKVK